MTVKQFEDQFRIITAPFIEEYNNEIGTNPILSIYPETETVYIEIRLLRYLPAHARDQILELHKTITW